MDGEWEAPQVPNPACETAPGCGEWKRPMINNPQYKGKWKATLVDNPNYQVFPQSIPVFFTFHTFETVLYDLPSHCFFLFSKGCLEAT